MRTLVYILLGVVLASCTPALESTEYVYFDISQTHEIQSGYVDYNLSNSVRQHMKNYLANKNIIEVSNASSADYVIVIREVEAKQWTDQRYVNWNYYYLDNYYARVHAELRRAYDAAYLDSWTDSRSGADELKYNEGTGQWYVDEDYYNRTSKLIEKSAESVARDITQKLSLYQ